MIFDVANARKNKIFRLLYYWGPLVAWLALIFFLSSLSFIPGGRHLPRGSDKFAHGIAFFGLAGFLFRTLYYGQRSRLAWALILALIGTSFYGILDEIHQGFVPHRSVDIMDWLADTIGAACALPLCFWLTRAERLAFQSNPADVP